MNIEQKRKLRRKKTAEDFTPASLVQEMLDKLPPEIFRNPSKTFLDNSAGNGNFLAAILERKLSLSHPPLQALSTIYGVELMEDNVEEMHHRLYLMVKDLIESEEDKATALKIIQENIICHDALTWDYENWRPPPSEPKAKALF